MSWQNLLASKSVQQHQTSRAEIAALREVVERDLIDASLTVLSADRRFATAYNAVLQASKIAIACAGYRVTTGAGHHRKTYEALRLALGKQVEKLADYFETCRRKRNLIDYDAAEVATETEAEELNIKAREFQKMVEAWIAKHHPTMKA